jgi:hypothetical protein
MSTTGFQIYELASDLIEKCIVYTAENCEARFPVGWKIKTNHYRKRDFVGICIAIERLNELLYWFSVVMHTADVIERNTNQNSKNKYETMQSSNPVNCVRNAPSGMYANCRTGHSANISIEIRFLASMQSWYNNKLCRSNTTVLFQRMCLTAK